METNNFNSGFREWSNSFIDVSSRKETMIRDEQRASKIQLTRELTELLDHTSAKNHSRPRLKIKTLHLLLATKRHKKHISLITR